ncbi:hypothetical protein KVR01_012690 [Diaporthe batatas]|uniref:uncharacterized protein n=1 Tax=Diaporthe batatas TaxID=748121 RepID=UPI001D05BCC6|nr:uncharacterized protein KVR01_012690 [Diaporthe batatas]KAG8157306.1 hypothetical protein KVR01_012690 [Diaporthe batatas]
MGSVIEPPASDSPDLLICQPTPEECVKIWSNTAASWKDSLTKIVYLDESQYLTTVPLAKDGGMTNWVLVDRNHPPNQRQILCSCESFRKRCLTSDKEGTIEEGIVHGVASVFCPSEYRGRGYGARHMNELAKVLREWQPGYGNSIGSILYSDIGTEYYAKPGWLPSPGNWHFVLPSAQTEVPVTARLILESELETLCGRDEAMVRKAMATPSRASKRVVVLPDLNHMLWHIRKEDFATNHILGEIAEAKGAIAGAPGTQVWIVWVRRYYEHPDHPEQEDRDGVNVLYVLRLVIEADETANKPHEDYLEPISADIYVEQAAALKSVLQAAQAEAAKWRLDQVQIWDPSPLAQSLLEKSGIDASRVERQTDSIASALWFTKGSDVRELSPQWINNEYYAWC